VPLPLPYAINDRSDVQGNFDALSRAWPNQGVGVFSAYRNAALSLVNASVVTFDTKERDVSGWFDITTNIGRFTPKVAGYYRFTFHLSAIPAAGNRVMAALHKNGALHKRAPFGTAAGGFDSTSGTSVQAQANGTTDFFEVGYYQSTGAALALNVGADLCYFQGELIAP